MRDVILFDTNSTREYKCYYETPHRHKIHTALHMNCSNLITITNTSMSTSKSHEQLSGTTIFVHMLYALTFLPYPIGLYAESITKLTF